MNFHSKNKLLRLVEKGNVYIFEEKQNERD